MSETPKEKVPTPVCQISVIATFYEHGFHINALTDASPTQAISSPNSQTRIMELTKSLESIVVNYIKSLTQKIVKEEEKVDYKQ